MSSLPYQGLFNKTYSHVAVAKKDAQHTHELFTSTKNSPISASRISKTSGANFTKFTYFMLYVTQPYIPNFKEIGFIVCIPGFLHLFILLLRAELKIILSAQKQLSCILISFRFDTTIEDIRA